MNYDVIIIGSGPAGLFSAHELAGMGRTVALIDLKSNMNDIASRACSMQLILDDDYEGEGIVVENSTFRFPKSGFSVPYNSKLVPIFKKYYRSPNGNTISFGDGKKPFSYKFDKSELLHGIYEECLKMGVSVYMNHLCTAVKDLRTHVEVTICDFNDNHAKKTLRCNKLIDAEGVNASIAQKLGMNKHRKHLATALTYKCVVKGIKGIEKNSWNLFYGKAYHTNAPVIIGPSLLGDEYNEVTISSDKNYRPDKAFSDIISNSPISDCFKGSEVVEEHGCSVKAFTPMKNPCKGNVIVIGDAAAFVEVETQGALLCGYHAAKAVNAELNGEKGWNSYTAWWQKSFEFNGDDYLRVSQGYSLVPTYTDRDLDYLFSLVKDKCLIGTYSQYKTPKLIWKTIREHDEKIRRERPSIFEKICNLNQMSLASSFE
ncbi:NAD(P)/FAD-dependent oxidoreductase [Butyrivibrio sp. X503]|uniref:NAD(P)/FAD-dependent oxidoreductase n=1 Tax=Butyrivibrio sp. X503 TaxID=2364878 RepID=UPI000EAA46A2|nr:NAD(P)/FAD-dependent oxidoreductase [Butyrivibrio sp. X503]RKM55228.1 NAD(P)/FAD-dependent oxidoreductase [Butyrivibrio sp. X503]